LVDGGTGSVKLNAIACYSGNFPPTGTATQTFQLQIASTDGGQ